MLYEFQEMTFDDELLGPNVLETTLTKAEQWLYVLAKRLGVQESDVIRSFVADELVTLYCYRETCMNKAASLVGQYSRNGQDDDYYSKKLTYINARIAVLENQITAEQLTGQPAKYAGYRCIPLYRGG
ncbi:hypothetical protein [uncultured Veillonella sp.]|jgi:hypothetical protein|uniref:hypothetical protein n=1 Tax=uncultured Veillonella sp. TaxID=159268 RepID=UPI00204F4B4E|nr:hypothetical protein [uncultured Veillonella sp.]DAJ15453.1 MAG TPA: hypothetical protein [Siphoviridae sp. ct7Ev5]DAR84523.1 MAG TPA: hypothetical protein [Caudoviricetes sp.]DAV40908.1 MAG TPA: hypothetical protein [Caudoviricetes sp.]